MANIGSIRLKNGEYTFEAKDVLGQGSFATVYKGIKNSTKEEVAIKKIDKKSIAKHGERLAEAIRNEIHTLQVVTAFENPYIIKIHDTFETENNIYIVLEYCDGGTLQDTLNKLTKIPEAQALKIIYEIILGLSALSESQIVHRDMKPENVFINKNVHKIGDFGFAREATNFQSSLGTCLYMAPEFYTG
jgi:serine/threonine protein kinase